MKLETESHLTFSWSFSVNLLSNLCRWVPWLLRNNEAMMEQMCSGEKTQIWSMRPMSNIQTYANKKNGTCVWSEITICYKLNSGEFIVKLSLRRYWSRSKSQEDGSRETNAEHEIWPPERQNDFWTNPSSATQKLSCARDEWRLKKNTPPFLASIKNTQNSFLFLVIP